MTHIQERALDLFASRGFAEVSVDDIAAAAEVSASTIYRYFGTKEGILIYDDFDQLSDDTILEVFDASDPAGSIQRMISRYETKLSLQDSDGRLVSLGVQRAQFFFEEPSVRSAVLAALDRAADRIAAVFAESGRMSPTRARVSSYAFTYAYFAILESWHLDGESRPIQDYAHEGLLMFTEGFPPRG